MRELTILQRPDLANIPQEDEPLANSTSEIDAMITNELVVFKNLPSFQEQYTRHLKIIRELGDRLERVTREQYEEQARIESQALEEAADLISNLQEELETQRRTHEIQIRGFIQERDMYKARFANQSPSKSIYTSQNGRTQEHLGDSEYEVLLAELQRNFDIYRTETGVDMKKLREELQESQRETAQLQASLAKANAKVENFNGKRSYYTQYYTFGLNEQLQSVMPCLTKRITARKERLIIYGEGTRISFLKSTVWIQLPTKFQSSLLQPLRLSSAFVMKLLL